MPGCCRLIGTASAWAQMRLARSGWSLIEAPSSLPVRSGSGKSTVATALTERMVERSFQFCIFDPEGDYDGLEHAVSVGDARTPPKQAEVLQLLKALGTNVVVNMQGLGLADRPPFFGKLLGEVLDMRARFGHPHWLIVDEAHHLVPAARDDANVVLNESMNDAILITVHPEAVSLKALRSVGVVAAVGEPAMDTLSAFAEAVGERPAGLTDPPDNEDEILVWIRGSGEPIRKIRTERPRQARTRHTQKYAEGDLGQDNSFYFRGPNAALNLRAQNLMMFLQIAEGVDDATWEHHLRRRDYSSWFRDIIKDSDLASEVAEVESDRSLNPRDSRQRIAEAVRRRYTASGGGEQGLSVVVLRQPRRAASIAAMSIFFIVIIASKARFASPPPAASASVSARGVICQERPQRSLHQPHALSWPPLPTIAFQ